MSARFSRLATFYGSVTIKIEVLPKWLAEHMDGLGVGLHDILFQHCHHDVRICNSQIMGCAMSSNAN